VNELERGIGQALEVARRAQAIGEPPFGAVILGAQGTLIAEASDAVRAAGDLSQHAEVNVVRRACERLGPVLSGATLYTTVEPCPMCFTAAWLARIDRLVFGATMDQVHAATQGAQRELRIPALEMNRLSGEPIVLIGDILADACLALFEAGTT
jgi:tRNA(Arg) A34 adenosine deaminase TadA